MENVKEVCGVRGGLIGLICLNGLGVLEGLICLLSSFCWSLSALIPSFLFRINLRVVRSWSVFHSSRFFSFASNTSSRICGGSLDSNSICTGRVLTSNCCSSICK
ncbi:unnamed protein product [Meloidogyne enterolobii]|uniref:Uncharacterized protein n=1 Tax=Meloidogyne enterolobii TaxID=390850 RepID=A0ACB1B6V2_MELEN